MTASFDRLGLSAPTLSALAKMGFEVPTDVQAQAIPPLLEGRDALVQAPTGCGKTAAFVIPMAERCLLIADHAHPVGLVLCPTRELANQGREVASAILAPHGFRTACLIGGAGMAEQNLQLRQRPQLIFGSPGRVMDHVWAGRLELGSIQMVVLDEADELLDQGFAPEVTKLLSLLPRPRQTMLVSATLPEWVRSVVDHELDNPVRISVERDLQGEGVIEHLLVETTSQRKFSDLCDLIRANQGSVIVFGRTKWGVQKLEKQLQQSGFNTVPLQGNMTQGQRDRAMDRFRAGRADVLVATNVAARGLDVRSVSLVVNYELPDSPELMTHRAGRTGRMGSTGSAITLLCPEDDQRWRRLRRVGAPELPRQHNWTEADKLQAEASRPAPVHGRRRSTPHPTPARGFRPGAARRPAKT
ncbi:MAG: DEAD/DEAH box helicase [Candidatus Dormibacteria bacterium]